MRIYSKYGRVFKILRSQREIKLAAFTHLGISPATLSKFENGKTMIKLDKLVSALDEMSISLGEYERFLNNFETILDDSLMQKTISAWILNDSSTLDTLYEEALHQKENACALALKSLNKKIEPEEIEWLYEYFDGIQFWRKIDLYSLYLTLDYFKERQLLYLLDIFFVDNFYKKMANSIEYNAEFVHVICKAVFIFSFKGRKETARHFLDYISPKIFSHTMYTKNLYDLTTGYWNVVFGNPKQGKEKMDRAISIAEILCDSTILRYYKHISEKYLNGKI